MAYSLILASITLAGLIIATITDLKTREVPDWLSYGLIAIGLGLNLLFSFAYSDYWFFISSLIGFAAFLIIALIMFYTGQWGGGDSKVLIGLGALIGIDVRFLNFPFLISLLANILLTGAIYGVIWSFALAVRNWKKFYKEFRSISHSAEIIRLRIYLFVFVVLILALYFFMRGNAFSSLLLVLLLMVLLIFYLWIFVKAVEKKCMLKEITPDKLTEGDWIFREVKYKGRYICGPKDLGIGKKQIRKLVKLYKENKLKRIMIKEGIPFVPSFLIAYIITLIWGNLLFFFV